MKSIRLDASEATVAVVEGLLKRDQGSYRAPFADRFRMGFKCTLVNSPIGFDAGCARDLSPAAWQRFDSILHL